MRDFLIELLLAIWLVFGVLWMIPLMDWALEMTEDLRRPVSSEVLRDGRAR